MNKKRRETAAQTNRKEEEARTSNAEPWETRGQIDRSEN